MYELSHKIDNYYLKRYDVPKIYYNLNSKN